MQTPRLAIHNVSLAHSSPPIPSAATHAKLDPIPNPGVSLSVPFVPRDATSRLTAPQSVTTALPGRTKLRPVKASANCVKPAPTQMMKT